MTSAGSKGIREITNEALIDEARKPRCNWEAVRAELLRRLASVSQPEPRWISVKDRLPGIGDLVLFVTTVRDGIEMGWRPVDDTRWQSVETAPQDEPIYFDAEQVTHWQELPAAPRVGERGSRG